MARVCISSDTEHFSPLFLGSAQECRLSVGHSIAGSDRLVRDCAPHPYLSDRPMASSGAQILQGLDVSISKLLYL
jgi:hypothetical protein